MNQFLAFIHKEFLHIFRDKRTMLILLGMPIMQIIVFGFAVSTEVNNVQIAVYDPSNDISSRHIINRIEASPYFKVVQRLHNSGDISNIFKRGKINLVIVFGENFNENLLHTGDASMQLIVDATDPNQATTITSYVTNIIDSYQQELLQTSNTPIRIDSQVKMLYNPKLKSSYNFVPGVMGVVLMLICAMMTSIAIVKEKEIGTMDILLTSPMKPIYIIIAKAVPYFLISMINLATILILAVFVLGVPIVGSLIWLIIVSVIFIIVALSLGLFISTSVRTQVEALNISGMALMVPIIQLSGMMFPIESMPLPLRLLSNIIPARWYISAVKKIMIEGLPISYALTELEILLAMALCLIFISLRKFKIRLD